MKLTPKQREILTYARERAVLPPFRHGGHRIRRSGEEGIYRANSINTLVARGLLVERPQGGFVTTAAGDEALSPL